MKINKRWNDESFIADLFEITENRVFCNGNRYFGNLFLIVIIRPLDTALQDIGGGGFSLILASIFSSSRTPMTWSGSQPEVSQIALISEEVTSPPPASRSSLN